MKYHRLIAFLLGAASLCGCSDDFFEQTVTIKLPPHTPVLAVTAQWNAGDTIVWAYVVNTVGILDKVDPAPVKNASVQLFRDGNFLATLSFDESKEWYSAQLAEPLPHAPHQYELRVSAPQYADVMAQQTMPVTVPILSATYEKDGALTLEGDKVDLVTIEWEDPAGVENFYEAILFFYIDSTEAFELYPYIVDPISENFGRGLYIRDDSFDGKKFKWRVGMYQYFQGFPDMRVLVRLRSISPDQYFFVRSLHLSDNARDNPFAEPVIIHTNMEGGVGVFTLGTVSEFVIEL